LAEANLAKNLLWLFAFLAGFGRRERKLTDALQHVLFLRREQAFELGRIEHLLALVGRHLTQIADSGLHHSAAIRGKLPHLLGKSASLLALLGGQVLPGIHTAKNAVLLLRRQAIEVLQPLA